MATYYVYPGAEAEGDGTREKPFNSFKQVMETFPDGGVTVMCVTKKDLDKIKYSDGA